MQIQSSVCSSQTVTSKGETFYLDFQVISEANTSELLENIEEMFLPYYLHTDVLNNTIVCVTR